MDKLKCQKCGHEWLPRTELVKECPKCKSRNWEEEQKPIVLAPKNPNEETPQNQPMMIDWGKFFQAITKKEMQR